jgi:DNA-binding MarR family transcriptional regulator
LQGVLYVVYSRISMPKRSHEDAATELSLALKLLIQRIRSTPSEANELSLPQIAVIKRLESGGPATTADLARAEGMKAQSMGTTIVSLEKMGMVERKPHPTDGRQMYIKLTAKGDALWKSSRSARRTWLAEAIARLDPAEQKNLPALTGLIKRLAEM